MFCVDKLKKSSAIKTQSLHTYSHPSKSSVFVVVCTLKLRNLYAVFVACYEFQTSVNFIQNDLMSQRGKGWGVGFD